MHGLEEGVDDAGEVGEGGFECGPQDGDPTTLFKLGVCARSGERQGVG